MTTRFIQVIKSLIQLFLKKKNHNPREIRIITSWFTRKQLLK